MRKLFSYICIAIASACFITVIFMMLPEKAAMLILILIISLGLAIITS